jgi:hypothetical protein
MNMKLSSLVLAIFFIVLALVACQTTPQTTQPSPTRIPPTNTSIPPSATPIPSRTSVPPTFMPLPSNTPKPTSTSMPTNTATPSGPTLTAQPERPVSSVDELIGVWKGFWQAPMFQEFRPNGEASIYWAEYSEWLETELYTFDNGILTWGKITMPWGEPAICLDNPVAAYHVYVSYRGDQRISIHFELVGEDNCSDRKIFLDGKTQTWVGTTVP